MNILRKSRYNRIEKVAVAATGILALLLTACGSGAELDEKPAGQADTAFIDSAHSTVVYPGKAGEVVQIQGSLADEYAEYDVFEQGDDWDGRYDNALSFKPRRFKTGFSEGDGSGADTVCEDLRVPESAAYVQATTTSDKQSWVFYNGEKDTAYLCYPSGNNPDDVMIWAGNQPR